jgi:hypothetical protein
MKQLLVVALLLCAVSCSTSTDIEYHGVRTVVNPPDVNNDTGGDLQYMAYCLDEERALSGWCDSRSEAASAASSYRSEHPDRTTTILWRQKPGGRLIPKHPRG